MRRPFPPLVLPGSIHARILHYLRTRGGTLDGGAIRCYADLGPYVTSPELWQGLDELVKWGLVLLSYRTETRVVYGFKESRTYPVFSIIEPPKGGEG